MKFTYEFSNLCGSSYKGGNLLFTPDGECVLSGVGNRISVFDLIHHKCRTLPIENLVDISCLALSPDGHTLISVDKDGRALLINLHKRVVLSRINFKGRVRCVKFSPDGRYIAVACDNIVQVWNVPKLVLDFTPFERLNTLTGHYDDVLSITWSHDSEFIFSCSKDMSVRMFSLKRREDFRIRNLCGHRDRVIACFLDKDLTLYTVSRDGALFVWRFERTVCSDDSSASAVLSEEPALARGSFRLEKKHFFQKHHDKIICADFHHSHNFSLLVIGFDSGVFGLYDLPACTEIHTLSISQHKISTVTVSSSGEWLAFGSKKLGQLLVWEWQSETYVLKQQGHFHDVNTLAYSPDGQLIATGGDDGKLKVWNADTGFCFITFTEHTGPITDTSFTNAGNVLLSSSLDGTVRAYDLVRYRNFRTLVTPQRSQFATLAIDPCGEIVCAGSYDQFDISVWSLQTGRLLDVLSGHEGPISGLGFSDERSLLVSTSWDGTACVWDVFDERKSAIETLRHSTDVLAVCVRQDGNEICTSALDGQLHFWMTETGKLKGVIETHRDVVGGRWRDDMRSAVNSSRNVCLTCIAYSPDGTCIIGGSNGKFICMYDIAQRMLVRKFQTSHNHSLDGVVDMLSSKRLTDAGPIDLIDDDDEDEDLAERLDKRNTLPGVMRGDCSARKTRKAIRTKCVRFAPTGRCFGAATTEGLMLYSLDTEMTFDPTDLDEDVTPDNVRRVFKKRQFSKALVMALRLNEDALIKLIIEHTPPDDAALVARSIDTRYLERVLNVLADGVESSTFIQLYLLWCRTLLFAHGAFMQRNSSTLLAAFRLLHKNLSESYRTLATLCNANTYQLRYLLAQYRRPREKNSDDKRCKISPSTEVYTHNGDAE